MSLFGGVSLPPERAQSLYEMIEELRDGDQVKLQLDRLRQAQKEFEAEGQKVQAQKAAVEKAKAEIGKMTQALDEKSNRLNVDREVLVKLQEQADKRDRQLAERSSQLDAREVKLQEQLVEIAGRERAHAAHNVEVEQRASQIDQQEQAVRKQFEQLHAATAAHDAKVKKTLAALGELK